MTETAWQPIETAPKDKIIFTYWGNRVPVFFTWFPDEVSVRPKPRWWPFRQEGNDELVTKGGWRVLLLVRDGGFAIHGNYAPFHPTHWQPLPDPPEKAE